MLQWTRDPSIGSAYVEKKIENFEWVQLGEMPVVKQSFLASFTDYLQRAGNYYYRLRIISDIGKEVYTDIKHVRYDPKDHLSIFGKIVKNHTGEKLYLLDLLGRYIHCINESEFDLDLLNLSGTYILQAGREIILIGL